MEEIKRRAIRLIKSALKKVARVIAIPVLIVCVIIILISALIYQVTIDAGAYKEDDWKSVGFGTAVYQSGATVNEDGTISTEKTPEEIWNELVNNHSDVSEYLSGPEALAKLMNAELITKLPDMRPNPDEPIDWSKIDLTKGENLQGIIKFKRADQNGNISTMTYVDSGTFYDWIERYNLTGDEQTRQNIISHFTLVESRDISDKVDFSGEVLANVSKAIVSAAQITPSPGIGLCQAWVRQVYVNAGLEDVGYASAYQAYQSNCISNDRNNIPVGAAVYGTGAAYLSDGSPNIYGHVGIYVGDIDGDGQGDVMDNNGSIRTISLSAWIQEQEQAGNTACGETPGWLGWGWQSGSPNIIENEESDDENSDENGENNPEDEIIEDGVIETEAKKYCVVATWTQTETIIETTDYENVEESTTTAYNMTTTQINYRELVDRYTMPFNFIWAFLVVGQSENFALELADLVYNSEIEITVHDNYTKNTDKEEWNYSEINRNEVLATATELRTNISDSIEFEDIVEEEYTTTKTVITQTNTLDISLTKANTWIVDYEVGYEHEGPTISETEPEVNEVEGTEFPSEPTETSESYEHEKIDELVQKVGEEAKQDSVASPGGTLTPNVVTDIHVDTYSRYGNVTKTVTHTVENSKYVANPPTLEEKTDPESEEPNFVTIFNKGQYDLNRNRILSAETWLFKIIGINEDTADMLDLVKYLLYKATTIDYGVTSFDFSIFYSGSLTSVGAGDYIVHTDKSPDEIVITDIDQLKTAFAGSGGAGSSNLVQYAEDFLEFQETYKVNAVFAAAVTTAECGAGTNLQIGGNNWFSIKDGSNGWKQYPSPRGSIEDFYDLIANGSYYFQAGKFTVTDIGMTYCENADAPGGWIENVLLYMNNMYRAAGIDTSAYVGEGVQYYQTEEPYASYPYGDSNIKECGCGPTSFAMVASQISGKQITPIDAVSWCGNSYYMAGVGTYHSYFQAAADHFELNVTIRQTSNINEVVSALKSGKLVISSQGPGLFTNGGHFIVLYKIDEQGNIYVKDPNGYNAINRGYNTRPFTQTEIDQAAGTYFIF